MIIGIGYRKQSGKDTAARHLIQKYRFQRLGFAEPLKIVCAAAFGLTDAQLDGDKKEVLDTYWGMTPRKLMQTVGTDLFRGEIGQDIWIKRWLQRLRKADSPLVVAPDLRFHNEVVAIKKIGGQVIRIDRDSDRVDHHKSESELDIFRGWDWTIDNNGSLEDLCASVDNIMDRLYIKGR